jgi:hypothetical protein
MSQQRPDEAKQILERAWTKWKDLDLDDPELPPMSTRLSLVKLFLELELYSPALLVLQGIMSTDDQEVEAWYLEGWCFFLMSERAKGAKGEKLDDISWEELAKDSRDCLETCRVVSACGPLLYILNVKDFMQLHVSQDHPDRPILEHARELIGKLDSLGIKPSPVEVDDQDNGEEWVDTSEGEEDVEME